MLTITFSDRAQEAGRTLDSATGAWWVRVAGALTCGSLPSGREAVFLRAPGADIPLAHQGGSAEVAFISGAEDAPWFQSVSALCDAASVALRVNDKTAGWLVSEGYLTQEEAALFTDGPGVAVTDTELTLTRWTRLLRTLAVLAGLILAGVLILKFL